VITNQYMGMVRPWQELLHGGGYAHSYTEALPDFVKLAEAYHAVGIRCEQPGDLDGAIREMIGVQRPVIFDCVVDPNENCFPMIPSGRAHNEMLLGDAAVSIEDAITEEGKVMVGARRDVSARHARARPAHPSSSRSGCIARSSRAMTSVSAREQREHHHHISRRRPGAAGRDPYLVGPGGQRAGRAGAGHRSVFRPRLQYRLAHRVRDRT